MKRLLCIVGKMDAGGAETFLMKIFRTLDKSKYVFDFCVLCTEPGIYDEEIKKLGGHIFYSTPKSKGLIRSIKSIYSIVKENKYDYVMRCSQNSMASLDLLAAKFAGAKVLVFRSTNTKTMNGGFENIIHVLFKPLVKAITTVKIAPSKMASYFMFGNSKSLLLNNGIPLDDYIYKKENCNRLREQLGISDNAIVWGHIGRFNCQKNHERLIDIFDCYQKKNPNSVLVLIGKGELENQIREQVKKLNLTNKVIFLGIRMDINEILSIFDYFVFPSFYEGLPNTLIEAQANGIPCVISTSITQEILICNNIVSVDLNCSNNEWVSKIEDNYCRIYTDENIRILRNHGYDIFDVTTTFIDHIFKNCKR